MLRRDEFVLADETVIEREVGQTWVRIGDEKMIRLVVFAPPGETPLLGADTLEAFLLAVDPVGKRLIRVPGLMKGVGSR